MPRALVEGSLDKKSPGRNTMGRRRGALSAKWCFKCKITSFWPTRAPHGSMGSIVGTHEPANIWGWLYRSITHCTVRLTMHVVKRGVSPLTSVPPSHHALRKTVETAMSRSQTPVTHGTITNKCLAHLKLHVCKARERGNKFQHMLHIYNERAEARAPNNMTA